MNKPVIIIGAGGHAKVVADILACQGRQVLGVLDDKADAVCGTLPRLGTIADAMQLADQAEFIIGIGNNAIRERIALTLSGKLMFTLAIHPRATVARDVCLGKGTVVMAGSVVNPGVRIGQHCILNTSSIVDHDSLLEDYVHISPGAAVAGTVHIGARTWIGAGAVVINNQSICADVMVGAGAVVVRDITSPGTYLGIPARVSATSMLASERGAQP